MAASEVRSVLTALRLLDEVAARQPVGVSELARALEIPKTSVQRALQTLHTAGWIQPIGTEIKRWGLTTHMLRISQRAAGELDLRNVAVPVMEELRSATRETVHLTVPEHDSVIVIERLDSPQSVRTFIPLGTAAPIAASANGKAILGARTHDEVRELLERGLSAYTPSTVTDEAALMAQLEEVRRRGYATNEEEWSEDVAAVASPITSEGRPIAGISVSTPAHRMTPELQVRYGELLTEAARRISLALERSAL